MTLNRISNYTVKVTTNNGRLSTKTPITVKSQLSSGASTLDSIQNILDVEPVDVTNGATIVYNASNNKFEIKHLDADNITGEFDLGEF